jgi:hypothetical protein
VEAVGKDLGLPVSTLLGEKRFEVEPEPFETRAERAAKALEALEPGLWLWVEHPGIDSPEQEALRPASTDRPAGWVGRDRSSVTRMLEDARLVEAIRKKGILLVDYRDLVGE